MTGKGVAIFQDFSSSASDISSVGVFCQWFENHRCNILLGTSIGIAAIHLAVWFQIIFTFQFEFHRIMQYSRNSSSKLFVIYKSCRNPSKSNPLLFSYSITFSYCVPRTLSLRPPTFGFSLPTFKGKVWKKNDSNPFIKRNKNEAHSDKSKIRQGKHLRKK